MKPGQCEHLSESTRILRRKITAMTRCLARQAPVESVVGPGLGNDCRRILRCLHLLNHGFELPCRAGEADGGKHQKPFAHSTTDEDETIRADQHWVSLFVQVHGRVAARLDLVNAVEWGRISCEACIANLIDFRTGSWCPGRDSLETVYSSLEIRHRWPCGRLRLF